MKFAASAPAKAILFGEHSVNRGQSALAVSVGLRARCTIEESAVDGLTLEGGNEHQSTTRAALMELAAQVDGWHTTQNYEEIRNLARADYFAPAKYILAHGLPGAAAGGLRIEWHSDIPAAGGLGSGAASFVALACALAAMRGASDGGFSADRDAIGKLAYLGDVIAHGGIASALDTQTSLHGGAIEYTQEHWGRPVPANAGLCIVIGNTKKRGPTSEVNAGVRAWLARDATRMAYFQMIGTVSTAARAPLAAGDWRTLGSLMNLNQLVLERIGVSTPQLEDLNRAALSAGAFGAKLSGSGGGGIMLALTSSETSDAVAHAITRAGGEAFIPPVCVAGAMTL